MPDTHLPLHLAPTAIEQLFPTLTGAQMARITWLYVASGDSVLVVAVMHSVLNALGDTFTSSRYIPDADPLVVSGGGLVGTGSLASARREGPLVNQLRTAGGSWV